MLANVAPSIAMAGLQDKVVAREKAVTFTELRLVQLAMLNLLR